MLYRLVRPLTLILSLVALLTGLSACALNVNAQDKTGDGPDQVRIQTEEPVFNRPQKPIVTLTVTSLVRQLYSTTLALPLMLPDQICTMEAGPHYTLTFLRGGKTLTTVVAKREGCRPVTIQGEQQDRQATQTFWSQLDQALQS